MGPDAEVSNHVRYERGADHRLDIKSASLKLSSAAASSLLYALSISRYKLKLCSGACLQCRSRPHPRTICCFHDRLYLRPFCTTRLVLWGVHACSKCVDMVRILTNRVRKQSRVFEVLAAAEIQQSPLHPFWGSLCFVKKPHFAFSCMRLYLFVLEVSAMISLLVC